MADTEQLEIILTKLVSAIQADEIVIGEKAPFDEATAQIIALVKSAEPQKKSESTTMSDEYLYAHMQYNKGIADTMQAVLAALGRVE